MSGSATRIGATQPHDPHLQRMIPLANHRRTSCCSPAPGSGAVTRPRLETSARPSAGQCCHVDICAGAAGDGDWRDRWRGSWFDLLVDAERIGWVAGHLDRGEVRRSTLSPDEARRRSGHSSHMTCALPAEEGCRTFQEAFAQAIMVRPGSGVPRRSPRPIWRRGRAARWAASVHGDDDIERFGESRRFIWRPGHRQIVANVRANNDPTGEDRGDARSWRGERRCPGVTPGRWPATCRPGHSTSP